MPHKRALRLSPQQIEFIGQFADYSFDYLALSFDKVVKKVMPDGFGTGPIAHEFRRQAQEVFERERES